MVYGADINRTAGSVINVRTCCHVHHVTPSATPSATRPTARGSRASVLCVRCYWSSSRRHRVGSGDSIDTFTCATRNAACSLFQGAIKRGQCGVLMGLAGSTQVDLVSRSAGDGSWCGGERVTPRFDEPPVYGVSGCRVERKGGHAMRKMRCSCGARLRGCPVHDLQVRLVMHPQHSLSYQLTPQLRQHCRPRLRNHLMATANDSVGARLLGDWQKRILSSQSSGHTHSARRCIQWDAKNRSSRRTLKGVVTCVSSGFEVPLEVHCQVRFLDPSLLGGLAARAVSRVAGAVPGASTSSLLSMKHNTKNRIVKGLLRGLV